jgi:hypothetical protein
MNPPGMKFLLVKKRRAPGFSPRALLGILGILPETLVRHRVGLKKTFPDRLGEFLRLLLHGDGGLALAVAEVVQLGTAD